MRRGITTMRRGFGAAGTWGREESGAGSGSGSIASSARPGPLPLPTPTTPGHTAGVVLNARANEAPSRRPLHVLPDRRRLFQQLEQRYPCRQVHRERNGHVPERRGGPGVRDEQRRWIVRERVLLRRLADLHVRVLLGLHAGGSVRRRCLQREHGRRRRRRQRRGRQRRVRSPGRHVHLRLLLLRPLQRRHLRVHVRSADLPPGERVLQRSVHQPALRPV
jgi:hypothetical protein